MSHDHRNEALLFEASGIAKTDETTSGISFNFTPIYDRMLVRVIPQKERTWKGLVLPAFAQENTPHIRAEVLAVGHGRVTPNGDTVPLVVRQGSIIAFLRRQDEQVVLPSAPGTEMMIIREFHVLGTYSDLPQATGVLDKGGKEIVSAPPILGADGKGLAS